MGKEIGIDFGTTTTEVSFIKNGYANAIILDKNKIDNPQVIPTVLFFNSEDDYIIGESALKKSYLKPKACIKDFKLFLTDINKRYPITAENGDEFFIKPLRATQLFLNKLIKFIQPTLFKEFGPIDGVIDKAVITVPAQFNPEEKNLIKAALTKAATNAGFTDIKLATEPTAAAIAFYDERCIEDGENILVYDLGGGTFDVSLISKNANRFSEIYTGGAIIGGNLFTERLAHVIWNKCLSYVHEYLGQSFYLPFDEDEALSYSEEEYGLTIQNYYRNRWDVFSEAEKLKIALSTENNGSVFINFIYKDDKDPLTVPFEISLEEFEKEIEDLIDRTIDITRNVIKQNESDGKISTIDNIVLAGGSSSIPLIKKKFELIPELKNSLNSDDPSTLIARGAAKIATIELEVEECTRFEIGTRVVNGKNLNKFKPIIAVGQALPCSGSNIFFPSHKGQTDIKISYYEKDVKNYPNATNIDDEGISLVSEVCITDLPVDNYEKVEVTFTIEKDGTPKIDANVIDFEGNSVKVDCKSIQKQGNLY